MPFKLYRNKITREFELDGYIELELINGKIDNRIYNCCSNLPLPKQEREQQKANKNTD